MNDASLIISFLLSGLWKLALLSLFPLGHVRKGSSWASLVVQWLRIRLPMQGTRVRALVR